MESENCQRKETIWKVLHSTGVENVFVGAWVQLVKLYD